LQCPFKGVFYTLLLQNPQNVRGSRLLKSFGFFQGSVHMIWVFGVYYVLAVFAYFKNPVKNAFLI